MARAQTGAAISARGRSPSARKKLRRFIRQRAQGGNLAEWRRGRAVLGYLEGPSVIALAAALEVTRGAINRWLPWYETSGVAGLLSGKAPGRAPKLDEAQRRELRMLVEAGPLAAG